MPKVITKEKFKLGEPFENFVLRVQKETKINTLQELAEEIKQKFPKNIDGNYTRENTPTKGYGIILSMETAEAINDVLAIIKAKRKGLK